MKWSVTDLQEVRRLTQTGEARETRERAKVTQPEVANEVGVTHACISRWENGVRLPKGEAAIRYLRVLRRLEAGNKSEEPIAL